MGFFDLFKPDAPGSINQNIFNRLITNLQSDNLTLRQKATDTLQSMGEQALAPLIRQTLLSDNNLQIRILTVLQTHPGISFSDIYACMKNTCGMENHEIIRLLAVPGENAIPYLLNITTGKDPALRLVAVSALAYIGEPAIPALKNTLSAPSYRVRSAAAEALTQMKWVPKSQEENIRFFIAKEQWSELIRTKKIAVPYLIGLLKDEYYGIRRDAAKTLGLIRDERALSPLIELLTDPESAEVCISAIEALEQIHDKAAIPSLITTLRHSSSNVQHMAAHALISFKWSPVNYEDKIRFLLVSGQWRELSRMGGMAIPYMVDALGDSHYGVRTGIINTLKGMGSPGMEALIEALDHQDPLVRKMIEDALDIRPDPSPKKTGPVPKKSAGADLLSQKENAGIKPLSVQKDPQQKSAPDKPVETHDMTGRKSLDTLHHPTEKIKTPPFSRQDPVKRVPPLKSPKSREFVQLASTGQTTSTLAKRERQPDFSVVAPVTPEKDTTEAEIELLIIRLRNKDENIRTLAVDALGRIGIPAISALSEALRDPSFEVRLAVAEALGRIGDEHAVQPLVDTLNDADEEVRAAAVRSLGEIGEFSAFVPLIQTLMDSHPFVRQNAEMALTAFGKPATGPIKKLLSHTNPLVRGSAAAILSKIGGTVIMPDLVALFSDPEEDVRNRAAIALGELGSPAIPVLSEILKSEDPIHRLCAVIGFGHAGPEAMEYLIIASRDDNPAVRENARAFLTSLDKAGAPSANTETPSFFIPGTLRKNPVTAPDSAIKTPPALISQLANPDKDLQIQAARDLAEMGDKAMDSLIDALSHAGPEAMEYLIIASRDDNPAVRENARAFLTSLDKAGAPSANMEAPSFVNHGVISENPKTAPDSTVTTPQALISQLANPDTDLQIQAARDLAEMGDKAVDSLIDALSHDSDEVQNLAVRILLTIGQPAIDPLINTLGSPIPKKRMSAIQMLDKINDILGGQVVTLLIGKLEETDPFARQRASEALGYLKDPEAIPYLIHLLDDPVEKVQVSAARALGRIGDEHAVTGLIGALQYHDERLRDTISEALINIGTPAIPYLVSALCQPCHEIRTGVAVCLDKLGWVSDSEIHTIHYLIAKGAWIDLSSMGEAVFPSLRKALASPDDDMRMGVILTLGKMQNPSAIELLIIALADDNIRIQKKAMSALVDKGESARNSLILATSAANPVLRSASEQILKQIDRKSKT